MLGIFRFLIASLGAHILGRRFVTVDNMHGPLIDRVVNQRRSVQLWEDQVLLFENESRDAPVFKLLLVLGFGADSGDFIGSKHYLHNALAEF